MKRLLASLVVMVLFSGCAFIGDGRWARIEAHFSAGDPQGGLGDYQLVITPDEVSYQASGVQKTTALPDGVWTVLVTGLTAVGPRSAEPCPGGESLQINAIAEDGSTQVFQASTCDTGDAFSKLQALLEQVIKQIN